MENSRVLVKSGPLYGNQSPSFSSLTSQRHVSYSCGTCGYELNLNSCNRITSTIGSKYGKSIKRGIISFNNIDESRFTQVDEFQCLPRFSKNKWSLFRHRTKLLCRKCGNHIGIANEDKEASLYAMVTDGSESSPNAQEAQNQNRNKYDVKIRALQPTFGDQGSGTPFFT